MASRCAGCSTGGADLLLIETIFDTLNAKAAIYAIAEQCAARGVDVPVMISGTITDRSGRLLSGQTPEAFWNAIRHASPVSVGLNCALGAEQMRAHIAEHGAGLRHADLRLSECRPAERVRALSREAPRTWRGISASSPTAGLVNIVGGCCGTTPEHISAIAEAVRGKAPRAVPEVEAACCGCPGSSRSRSRRKSPSSTSASAPTSPARRNSASSSPPATTRRRSRSRATRSRTARRSSTSTWTRACSIPPRR